MNKQNLNNSEACAKQGANKTHQAIKLGLDVHADSIVVVRILDHSAPQPAQRFTPKRFVQWARTQLALADQVHSCYEAGPFGYGLHRDLIGLGIENRVVQAVCLDERHKGVNNDKTDAKELASRLDRYVAGNTHVCLGSALELAHWLLQRRSNFQLFLASHDGSPKVTEHATAIISIGNIDLIRYQLSSKSRADTHLARFAP